MTALRAGVWVWCVLAIPTMFSWFTSTGWYVFMGFSGLTLILLTNQRVVHIGGGRKEMGGKEEDQLDGST